MVDLPLFLVKKLLLMKLLSEIHEMFLNQSLEFMQVSSTTSQCVKRCQRDCTRGGSMQKMKATNDRSRNFENMVVSFYQERKPEWKYEKFFMHL